MALKKVAINVSTGLAIKGVCTDFEWGSRLALDDVLNMPMKSSRDLSNGEHRPVNFRQKENRSCEGVLAISIPAR